MLLRSSCSSVLYSRRTCTQPGRCCKTPPRASRQTVKPVAVATEERPATAEQSHVTTDAKPLANLPGRSSGGSGAGWGGDTSAPEKTGTKRLPQIFISFTGQDADAHTFAASILRPALQASGLPTFMDYANLQPGSDWAYSLERAASSSRVVVVVLSKSYQWRFWCMRELHLCRTGSGVPGRPTPFVIPVLYDAKADVLQPDSFLQRWGPSGNLYTKQSPERQALVEPQAWLNNMHSAMSDKQALRRRLQSADRDEDRRLAGEVVRACMAHLPPLQPVDKLVGHEQQLLDIVTQLGDCYSDADGSRLGVWLHGCGGSGKTAMARMIWNYLVAKHTTLQPACTDFQQHAYYRFSMDNPSDPTAIRDILQQFGVPVLETRSMQQQLQEFVSSHKVLYVLDNVSRASQLDELLPAEFAFGSIVIVTSREKELPLSTAREVAQQLYRHAMAPLKDVPSTKLYCRWAKLPFDSTTGQPAVDGDCQQGVTDIVKACAGLPLALLIMGAALERVTDYKTLKDARNRLERGSTDDLDPERSLSSVLSYSFNTLRTTAAQQIFLDAATVLSGQPKAVAVAVWEALYDRPEAGYVSVSSSLKTLDRRCLLESSGSQLQMHDVLRYLGRAAVLEDNSLGLVNADPIAGRFIGSRLFVSHASPKPARGLAAYKEGYRSVTGSSSTPSEALQVFGGVQGQAPIAAQLDADGVFAPGGLMTPQPVPQQPGQLDLSEMRLLRLGRARPTSPLDPSRLVFLDLHLEGGQLPWNLPMQEFSLLVGEDIMTTLAEDERSGKRPFPLPCPIIVVRGAQGTGALSKLLGTLRPVQELYLAISPAAAPAVTDWLRTQTQLEYLAFCHSPAVVGTEQVQAFSNLHKLKILSFENCVQMEKLPAGVCSLSRLEILDLSGCAKLQGLPNELVQMTNLKVLNLRGCPSLNVENILNWPDSTDFWAGVQLLQDE